MTDVKDIGWGRYKNYEGPYYRGRVKFDIPSSPTREDKILAVITATEGGTWDSINMYDRCILTSGLIQWCEAGQYSVSDMLGAVADTHPSIIFAELGNLMAETGVEFKKNDRGRWRFFFEDERGEVDRKEEQQQLFLGESDGTIGSWDDYSKQTAKEWAAAVSCVWEHKMAQKIQKQFTVSRLGWFAMPFSKHLLKQLPDTRVGRAFEAAFLSFAANNPRRADKHLRLAMESTTELWTPKWFEHVMKEMTFGPSIAIYPDRYNKIRPVLEQLYGVDLPDFADDMHSLKKLGGWVPVSTVELQRGLEALGYDIGESGADGVFGKLTKAAVVDFQTKHSKRHLLVATGDPDYLTTQMLERELKHRAYV